MVGPALHLNFHALDAHRLDPPRLLIAESQSDREFHPMFFYEFLLQRAPTTSDIEDASSTIGARLLNVVREFPLLSCFERVGGVLVHGARVTTLAIEE